MNVEKVMSVISVLASVDVVAHAETPGNDCLRYAKVPIEQAIVRVESSFNPFAIGVVGGALVRQPRNKPEAIATAKALKEHGYDYSMGCRQVNQSNLFKYGLDLESVFDPLKNSLAGSHIYDECHMRAVIKFGDNNLAKNAALSCYYSGNFSRGQQKEGGGPSYVEKVLSNLPEPEKSEEALAIPVVMGKGKKSYNHQKNKNTKTEGVEKIVVQKADLKQSASWDVFKDF